MLQCSSDELQALQLEAVLDLRVLKKHCRREADQIDAEIRHTDSREKANQMRALNPDGASSSEDVSSTIAVKVIIVRLLSSEILSGFECRSTEDS